MFKKKIIRLIFAITLFFLLFSQLDIEVLITTFKNVDKVSYVFAIFFCALANILCAMRWKDLLKGLRIEIPTKDFIIFYFESIAVNCILPGGILGGDVWRTTRVAQELNKNNSSENLNKKTTKKELFQSIGFGVLADRIHGFWSLCIIGFVCSFFVLILDNSIQSRKLTENHSVEVFFYLIILLFISFLPLLVKCIFLFFKGKFLKISFYQQRWNDKIKDLSLVSFRKSTVLISLSSQIFFGLGFWVCFFSIGLNINVFIVLLVIPGIFLFASLPISVGGFGPREVGSLLFLLPLGISNELIFVSSILFGLTSTIIGLITVSINLLLQTKK